MRKLLSALTALCLLAGCASGSSSDEASAPQEISVSAAEHSVTVPPAEESKPDEVKPYPADPTPLVQQGSTPMPDFAKVAKEYSDSRDSIAETLTKLSEGKAHPCINITTEGGEKIQSKYHYAACVIDVFNCGEQYVLSANGGVKIRGNSTAEQGDEKPYRIKFETKHNMLGLHEGKEYKSWVLLRSYWNLAPDYMAFSLAKAIFEGKYYSSDFAYVNLSINGEPRGIYLLCEQNQTAEGRIDVSEPSKDETKAETGYLLEMDNYPSEEHPFFELEHLDSDFADINGVSRETLERAYSVRSRINTKGQLEFISKYLDGCFKILYEAAEHNKAMMFNENYDVVSAEGVYDTPQQAAEAVIDTESLANMLILEELVHNNDVGAGSFYMAIDFTEQSKYKKLTFLAPWDFNWAYEGEPDGGYYASTFQTILMDWDRSNPWFMAAMKGSWFQDTVKAKWKYLHDKGALKDVTRQVVKDCQTLKDELGSDDWKIEMVKNLRKFVNGRIEWLDAQWLQA